MSKLNSLMLMLIGIFAIGEAHGQTSRPKIPISVQCSCPDRLGEVFETKLNALILDSTPYQLSDKSKAVFRYIILSTDGYKTGLAPKGHLSAISVLITGDRNEWVHQAVYAVTDKTVDEAAQNDLRDLSKTIMEAMRQRN